MRQKHFRFWMVLLCVALAPVRGDNIAPVANPTAASAPRFTITDLGTLPGGEQSGAYGINNKGRIVGWSDTGTPGPPDMANTDNIMIHNHAVLWDNGQPRDLGLLKGFPFSSATAINDKGQVGAGWDLHFKPGNGGSFVSPRETFLWQKGKRKVWEFGTAPSFDKLTAINNAGEIVGQGIFTNGVYGEHPLARIKGKIKDLGLLPGATEGIANGINATGDIVGWESGPSANGKNDDYCAFLYHNGKMTNLDDDQIGSSSIPFLTQAFAINNHGVIVGQYHGIGCIWQAGKRTRLFMSSAKYSNDYKYNSTSAYAINNNGQVVGTANDGLYGADRAFFYDGAMHDLNDLVPANSGWILKKACGINDKGLIVGSGAYHGKDHAYLLTPAAPSP